ncbi:hypothetical protein [Pseudomonas putida]|uniref:Uncharacterized protein n=1 Tax=Pseudomonas putida TaxID=303 RepID=A0A8I1EA95_PSEPU|nr:hypothetical protein [Pseudomonas putida]MBI6882719.1 hypothetical protein [Pseudomonas putida]
MRSTITLARKYSAEMKAAYEAGDSISFVDAATSLKAVALRAISSGFREVGSDALESLCEGMGMIQAVLPTDFVSHRGRVSVDFLSTVMPIFGNNSREAAVNLGASYLTDEYILAEKVNFQEMAYDHLFGTFLYHALRNRQVDDFIVGLRSACSDLLDRQVDSFASNGEKKCDCYRYNEQVTLLRVFEKAGKNSVEIPALPEDLDDLLASALKNLCHGEGSSFSEDALKAMQAAGLHKSIRAALKNVYSVRFNLDDVEIIGMTLDDAANALGMNCYNFYGPNLVKNIAKYEPDEVKKAMHPMSYKQSACKPDNLMSSCSAYINSDDFAPESIDVLNVLLECAFSKWKKTALEKGKDFELFRSRLTAFNIPDRIQFKLPMLKDMRVKILESEMGM